MKIMIKNGNKIDQNLEDTEKQDADGYGLEKYLSLILSRFYGRLKYLMEKHI